MLPVSHVLWTSLWLGLASDAVGRRARSFAPRRGGRRASCRLARYRLAETVAELGTMRATVHGGRDDFERHQDDPEALGGLGFAIRMNNLKVSASRMAPEIVARALGVCGISGYRCDSPYAVGRHLRDAHGAALMISNDRVLCRQRGDAARAQGRLTMSSTQSAAAVVDDAFRDELLRERPADRDRRPGRVRAQRRIRRHACERIDRFVAARSARPISPR